MVEHLANVLHANPPRRPRRRASAVIVDGLAVLLVVLAVISLVSVLMPELLPLPNPYRQRLLATLQPPSAAHLLGTDSLGRDVLARALSGLQISIVVAVGSVSGGLIIGSALGVMAGFYRGPADTVISAAMNVVLAFPPLVLATAIMAFAGASLMAVIAALGILFVPSYARIARANTLRLGEREFVLAARASGMTDARILCQEILPNLVVPLLTYSLLMVSIAIIGEGALSFLGLSIPPPRPTLGGMIAAERGNLLDAPWAVFGPAAILFLLILALNLVGDQMQSRFDRRESAL